jgi:hypothetical protein
MYASLPLGGLGFNNCTFSGNKAVLAGTTHSSPSGYGGAVYVYGTKAGFRHCTFASNSVWGGAAANTSTVILRGGALFHSGP